MQLSLIFLVVSSIIALSTAYPYAQETNREKDSQGGRPGGWSIDVDRERGGGTRVRGEVNKRFETDNGKIRGEIRGHIDRTYGGSNDGTRSRGVGISIGGDWR